MAPKQSKVQTEKPNIAKPTRSSASTLSVFREIYTEYKQNTPRKLSSYTVASSGPSLLMRFWLDLSPRLLPLYLPAIVHHKDLRWAGSNAMAVSKRESRRLLVAVAESKNARQCEHLVRTSTSAIESTLVGSRPRVMHSLESLEKDNNDDLRSNVDEAYAAVVLASRRIFHREDWCKDLVELRAAWNRLRRT
nr:unnamed protein product [Spirometra erinaceieuropaei]